MYKKTFGSFALLLLLLFWGCTPAQQDLQKTESDSKMSGNDSVYVFDEVTADTTEQTEEPIVIQPAAADTVMDANEQEPEPIKKGFCVQLGAFSTKERALEFASLAESRIKKQCRVLFRKDINLHAVQLPVVATKEAADKMKNEVKKIKDFKDAFVVEVK